ncbi:30S ribosomal protein S5 [archaeon]|nr:30S ribosomal protein S5 [archaeon]|tara:strand:- start:559 stop:1311 length:753 start_codon:yes stop_codon:yes gene_type:complete
MQKYKQRKRPEESGISQDRGFDIEQWSPKTELGKKIKTGDITSIDQILDQGKIILEAQIVDALIQEIESDLIEIGQSKGKFGGGKSSIWRQTQKKTKEGNKPSFSTVAVVGNKNGYVGIGKGKAKETVPAREKATRQAKLNLIKVKRGCGSWECCCGEAHSIPFKVEGKCGSVRVVLMPAPKGTGLCAEKECQKILRMAGLKDVYAKSYGQTKTKLNFIKACFEALRKLGSMKVKEDFIKKAGIVGGRNE